MRILGLASFASPSVVQMPVLSPSHLLLPAMVARWTIAMPYVLHHHVTEFKGVPRPLQVQCPSVLCFSLRLLESRVHCGALACRPVHCATDWWLQGSLEGLHSPAHSGGSKQLCVTVLVGRAANNSPRAGCGAAPKPGRFGPPATARRACPRCATKRFRAACCRRGHVVAAATCGHPTPGSWVQQHVSRP